MRILTAAIALTFCASWVWSVPAHPNSIDDKIALMRPDALRAEKDIMRYVFPEMRRAGKFGRIYYNSFCDISGQGRPPLPKLIISQTNSDDIGIGAIRKMLSQNKFVTVSEGRSGIIDIYLGIVSKKILDTRIGTVSLSRIGQYNPTVAIINFESTPEMRQSTNKAGISLSSNWLNVPVLPADDRYPHLPPSIADVAMDQALDEIAATFGGIVVYAACNEQHLYYTDFLGGYRFDKSAPKADDGPK